MDTSAKGIMFHNFFDGKNHIKSQGALSSEDLENMILYLKYNYKILDIDEWLKKYNDNTITNNEVCLTFDDGLSCQYDIALPILEKYNIKALFSVFTHMLSDEITYLEVFRYFRNKYFDNMDDFYDLFFKLVKDNEIQFGINYTEVLTNFESSDFLSNYTIYTYNDRKYRYLRDVVLSNEQYVSLYINLMSKYNLDIAEISKKLYMTKENIVDLHKKGHTIGLHSHTHPTAINTYSYSKQLMEYATNKYILENIIQDKIHVVAYPLGRYTKDTEDIMKTLDITNGFCSNVSSEHNCLFLQRIDHMHVFNEMLNK